MHTDNLISNGGGKKSLLSVSDFVAEYNISRTVLYQEIRARKIEICKMGLRTFISRRAADEWLSRLEEQNRKQRETVKKLPRHVWGKTSITCIVNGLLFYNGKLAGRIEENGEMAEFTDNKKAAKIYKENIEAIRSKLTLASFLG